MRLLGQYGDSGLIIRANDEEEGVDAYHGYMAGLRDLDNTLILGRADYGWREYVAKTVSPRVYDQQWGVRRKSDDSRRSFFVTYTL